MNVENNGKEIPHDDVELTDLALGQLDEKQSRMVEKRIAQDAQAKRAVRETELVAAASRQSTEHKLPSGIDGLQSAIQNAFESGVVSDNDGAGQVANKPQPSKKMDEPSGKRMMHWAVVAAIVLLMGGVGYMLNIERAFHAADENMAHISNPPLSDLDAENVDLQDDDLAGSFSDWDGKSGNDPSRKDRSNRSLMVMTDEEDGNVEIAESFDMAQEQDGQKDKSSGQQGFQPEVESYGQTFRPDGVAGREDSSVESKMKYEEGQRQQTAVDETTKLPIEQPKMEKKLGDDSREFRRGVRGGGGFGGGNFDSGSADSESGSAESEKVQSNFESMVVPTAPGRNRSTAAGPVKEVESLSKNDGLAIGNSSGESHSEFKSAGEGKISASPKPESVRGRGEVEVANLDSDEDNYGYFFKENISRRDRDRLYQSNQNEQYESLPPNPFLPVAGDNQFSTFSIDVDTASYSNVRRFIRNRQLPPPASVRIEEMVNYFDYEYPQPEGPTPFSASMEVAACPWEPSHKLLRVGIKGKEVHRDERPQTNLVFLIDVSGSMSGPKKLPLLKSALNMLVEQLGENDRVSIVTYSGSAGVQLEPTTGDQKDVIRGVINNLHAGGSTHGSAGIQMAYDKAAQHFVEEGVNRVMLATDGDLNVGITDDNALVQLIKDRARTGVFLSVLGFGTGNLKDAKLEKLADNGNGVYAYIDSIREAQRVLVQQMSANLVTIAKDVKIQLEFNPLEVRAYRLIGYENRVLANQDFENDNVDAGEIGAGHTVTALYELVPVEVEEVLASSARESRYQQALPQESNVESEPTDAARSGELVHLKLRYKKPDAEVGETVENDFVLKDAEIPFEEASDDFRFATSVAALGMVLRHSKYADHFDLEKIQATAAGALGDDPSVNKTEFIDLILELRQIAR